MIISLKTIFIDGLILKFYKLIATIIGLFKTYFNKFLILSISIAILAYQLLDGYKFFVYSQAGILIDNKIQDFLTLVLSIVIEAFPFIVIGVVVSVLVGIFVKEEWIIRVLPKNRFLSHIIISLFGILMPVCECGNIPVARRLITKGFSVSQSITFLLAAPIINPITYIVTLEAFNYDHSIVLIRMVAAFIIANVVGIIVSFHNNQNELLTFEFYNNEVCEVHEHKNKLEHAIEIFQDEFFVVIKVLCIGAIFAALSQTIFPRSVISAIGTNPFYSIIAMVILAFVVSICSNVDAFFALSYANSFTVGSIISFLIFGPMIDIKILTMMKTTYKFKLLFIIVTLVTLMSVLTGLLVNLLK